MLQTFLGLNDDTAITAAELAERAVDAIDNLNAA